MSPEAFYASTHRVPFSETSTQNKGLFGTPGVKGSLLRLRSIPTSKGSEVAGAGSSYMQIHMMQTSQQSTHKVPSYHFQQAVRRKSWTLNRFISGSGTQSKGRSHMFAIFSQALSWSEASFRRDVPSTPWSFPPSWPLLTSFHLLALAQVAFGPFKWTRHVMIHIFTGKTLTVSYSQWISQRHTLMAFAQVLITGMQCHGMAILAFFFRPVSLHSGN